MNPQARRRIASGRTARPISQGPEPKNDAKASLLAQTEIKRLLFECFDSDPLLGSAQTAAALDLSPVHLRRLARAGKIPPPLVIGYRKLGWRLSTIKGILAEREETAQRAVARGTCIRTKGRV